MEINKEWFKKDFEQKFYLYCKEYKFTVKTFGSLNNKSYIAPKIIKIEEL